MRTDLEYEELDINCRVVSNVVVDGRVKLILWHRPAVLHTYFLQQLPINQPDT